jgi:hypothetical protein
MRTMIGAALAALLLASGAPAQTYRCTDGLSNCLESGRLNDDLNSSYRTTDEKLQALRRLQELQTEATRREMERQLWEQRFDQRLYNPYR